MKDINELCTVIIRSAHERTEELCNRLLLEDGIAEENLFVIHEVPFSKSMHVSFQLGLRENRKWTLCIDADVLVRKGAVKDLLNYAEKMKSEVCEIQGVVLDKFFGGMRQAGNHLYRTSLLEMVINQIPEEGVDIRPETYTLRKMEKMGYPWHTVPCIVGLHDHEQYNFDIYRKAFIHAEKHLERAELLVTLWKEKRDHDPDYKVALKGFSDGIVHSNPKRIDISQTYVKESFMKSGISEKNALSKSSHNIEKVAQLIDQWDYHPLYHYYFPNRDGYDSYAAGYANKFRRKVKEKGFLKTILYTAGSIMEQMGRWIRKRNHVK